MAYSQVMYYGDGTTKEFDIPFPYISQSHIKVSVNGVEQSFIWVNSTRIMLSSAPANGALVLIRRETSPGSRLVDFFNRALIREADLDKANTQMFYLIQEALDKQVSLDNDNHFNAQNKRIKNVADPVDANDVATKGWVETSETSVLVQAIKAKNAAETAAANAATSEANAAAYADFVAQLSGKNLILNGDFLVDAFNVQQTTTLDPLQTCRPYVRWRATVGKDSSGSYTVSRTVMSTGRKALRIEVDTPASFSSGAYVVPFMYIFEGAELYSYQGKTLTLSFDFVSNIAGTFAIAIRNETQYGEEGKPDPSQFDSYVTTFNYNTPRTPQRISHTFTLPTTWTYPLTCSANRGIRILIAAVTGPNFRISQTNTWISGVNKISHSSCTNWANTAGNYVEIAAVQLEEGNIAHPFTALPPALTQQLCQRYLQTVRIRSISGLLYYRTNDFRCNPITFYPMRTVPTVSPGLVDGHSINFSHDGAVTNKPTVTYAFIPQTSNTLYVRIYNAETRDFGGTSHVVAIGSKVLNVDITLNAQF